MSLLNLLLRLEAEAQKKIRGRRSDARARAGTSIIDILDQGIFVNPTTVANNASVTLYTVPPGRTFYWIGYDANVYPLNSAIAVAGDLDYCDSIPFPLTTWWAVVNMWGAIGCVNIHSNNIFPMFSIPEGWAFTAWADANTVMYATIFGVLF